MEALESGEDYETLPDTFVIFICDFDPFDRKFILLYLPKRVQRR